MEIRGKVWVVQRTEENEYGAGVFQEFQIIGIVKTEGFVPGDTKTNRRVR